MISALAVGNYRSLLKLVVPLGRLNVITGRNGSGKSNLFRVLRLLADTAQGGIIHSLAREGGMASTLWAGPEKLSRDMKAGRVPIQGGLRVEDGLLGIAAVIDKGAAGEECAGKAANLRTLVEGGLGGGVDSGQFGRRMGEMPKELGALEPGQEF